MKDLANIFFLVGLAVWIGWVLFKPFRGYYLEPKPDGAAKPEPPTDAEYRIIVSKLCQDISVISVTNFAILLVLIFSLVLKL